MHDWFVATQAAHRLAGREAVSGLPGGTYPLQTKGTQLVKRIGTLIAALALLAVPGSAAAPAVSISGGGQATFDSAPGGTIFSVQAQIAGDGSGKGHFFVRSPELS